MNFNAFFAIAKISVCPNNHEAIVDIRLRQRCAIASLALYTYLT